jgi:hypothetical protein
MQAVSSICRRPFLTDLSFSSATGRGRPLGAADVITGPEPAAVTESQRYLGLPPCEMGAERRVWAAGCCVG